LEGGKAVPVEYHKDDRGRLLYVTATEPLSFEELLSLVERQWIDGAWDYALLYDMRATVQGASEEGLRALVDRVEAVGNGRPRGPVGLAVPLQVRRFNAAAILSGLAGRNWNLEVLLTEDQLAGWLRRWAPHRQLPQDRDQSSS
jgi:hypothetical protein